MRGTKRALAAVALAAVATMAGGAAASAGGKPAEPSLVGSVKLARADGDDVRFAIDAHGLGPDARGTFRVSHRSGAASGWFAGKVDCLVVGGPVAVLTGVVTDTNLPELKGLRRGITVYDNGKHDRLGYSWVIEDGKSVPKCLSSAPFERVESGDFEAVEWFPPAQGPKWTNEAQKGGAE
ncbi:hypothetical protein [Amycolatopsis sp. NPDC059021]|uniref:hypothetical protein n=1 Tax=Amycolatopsis sp. NPDC059021 TaxID=3346704 RepID=UPI00366DE265